MICYVAENKNDQETGDRVNYVPQSCSYIVGGELCHPAGTREVERGIVCLVSDTTLRHNTTFSIIYIFFFTRVIEQEHEYIHVYIETAYHL